MLLLDKRGVVLVVSLMRRVSVKAGAKDIRGVWRDPPDLPPAQSLIRPP